MAISITLVGDDRNRSQKLNKEESDFAEWKNNRKVGKAIKMCFEIFYKCEV